MTLRLLSGDCGRWVLPRQSRTIGTPLGTCLMNQRPRVVIATASFHVDCSKHGKKPSWLPMAKSKLYYPPPPKDIPKDEQDETKRLWDWYRVEYEALRRHFQKEQEEIIKATTIFKDHASEVEHEYEMMRKAVQQHNEAVALDREIRQEKARIEEQESILQQLTDAEAKQHYEKIQAEKIIQETEEIAKQLIKPEHLDVAIEKALSQEIDYNFAIDLDGFVYKGRTARPMNVPADERERIPSSEQWRRDL